jgi:hypothetical protein
MKFVIKHNDPTMMDAKDILHWPEGLYRGVVIAPHTGPLVHILIANGIRLFIDGSGVPQVCNQFDYSSMRTWHRLENATLEVRV